MAYLETLILEDTLDSSILARWGKLSLEDDTERTIADNFALGILKLSGFASYSILDALTDDFCKGVSRCVESVFGPGHSGQ